MWALSGEGRKRGERERSGERTFQKTLQRHRSVERQATERGSGVESGCHENRLECCSENRPLTLRSHALLSSSVSVAPQHPQTSGKIFHCNWQGIWAPASRNVETRDGVGAILGRLHNRLMRIHGIEHFPPTYQSANLGRSYVLYSTSRGRCDCSAKRAENRASLLANHRLPLVWRKNTVMGTQKYCTVGSLGFCCNFGGFWLFQLVFPVAPEVPMSELFPVSPVLRKRAGILVQRTQTPP